MNNSAFGKTMQNIRKYRAIKLVTTKKENKLFGIRTKLLYNKTFHRKFISNRNEKKPEILIKNPVYLGLSI